MEKKDESGYVSDERDGVWVGRDCEGMWEKAGFPLELGLMEDLVPDAYIVYAVGYADAERSWSLSVCESSVESSS